MDICILCLEVKHESVDFLKVESISPTEASVEEVIERHLWPMESITNNSWLCKPCWNTLYDFHKFYRRVEEAHEDLAQMLENEIPSQEDDQLKNDFHNILNSNFSQQISELCSAVNLTETSPTHEIIPSPEHTTPGNLMATDQNLERLIDEMLLPINATTEETTAKPLDEEGVQGRQNGRHSSDEEQMSEDDPASEQDPLNKDTKKISKCILLDVPRSKSLRSSADSEDSYDENDNAITKKDDGCDMQDIKSLDDFITQHIKLECEICHATLQTFPDLRSHFRAFHKKNFYVKCCNKTIRRRSILADHIRWHKDPECFKCHLCGKLLAARRCLELHMTSMHLGGRLRKHVCNKCGKSFADLRVLNCHMKTHMSQEEKKFRCLECNKSYGCKNLLNAHVRTIHMKLYRKICNICGKDFRLKSKFDRHLQEHQGIVAAMATCDICGFKSVDEPSLKRHKLALHPEGGRVEYKCEICDKISPSLRAHKMHVHYKHVLEPNYKCPICEKAFKKPHSLAEHKASHTQTALYSCPHCPKTFNSNGNLHKHRKLMHLKEWEEARREKFSGETPPPTQKPATY